jgi:hypothetical protein
MIPVQSLEMTKQVLDGGLGVKTRRVSRRVLVQNMGFLIPGRPPPPPQYKTEVVEERTEQWSKLVGLLFCMPTSKQGKDQILPGLDYFHHRSGVFVDFFCLGYGTDPGSLNGREPLQPITAVNGTHWYFDSREFNACRAQLEAQIKWRYSGETDLILAVARKPKAGLAYIDYSCAIACNLEQMERDGAIQSIRAFFEKIFQFGEQYKGDDPVWKLSDKFGIEGGGQLLLEALLTLVPEEVRKRYKALRHLAISDVSR